MKMSTSYVLSGVFVTVIALIVLSAAIESGIAQQILIGGMLTLAGTALFQVGIIAKAVRLGSEESDKSLH